MTPPVPSLDAIEADALSGITTLKQREAIAHLLAIARAAERLKDRTLAVLDAARDILITARKASASVITSRQRARNAHADLTNCIENVWALHQRLRDNE